MAFTYELYEEAKKKNCFEVKFEFEHGDADCYTSQTINFGPIEDELIEYLKKFEEIANMIDESRSYGTKLPNDFKDKAHFNSKHIPLDLDVFAKTHMHYAAMYVAEIYYYNADGVKYKVTIS